MTLVSHNKLAEVETYISGSKQRHIVTGNCAVSTRLTEEAIPPGGFIPPHYHDVEETLTFLSGAVEVEIDGQSYAIKKESTIVVPPNAVHGCRNMGPEQVRLLAFFPISNPKTMYSQDLFELRWNDPARKRIYKQSRGGESYIGWIFEQMDLCEASTILEIGCGEGELWQAVGGKLADGCQILVADWSREMVSRARSEIANGVVADIRSLPIEDQSICAVVALHVCLKMNHLLNEIRRVLKPGGQLFLGTAGAHHLSELADLVTRFDSEADFWGLIPQNPLNLDNGLDQLSAVFDSVDLVERSDTLFVTEADSIVDFVLTTNARQVIKGKRVEEFREFVCSQIAEKGQIVIDISRGLFKAGVSGPRPHSGHNIN